MRIFPALFALPLLFKRFTQNRCDPLVLLFLFTLTLYIYGGVSQQWAYGRSITFIVLILHLLLAHSMSQFERRLFQHLRLWQRKLGCSVIILTLMIGLTYANSIRPVLDRISQREPNKASSYMFLKHLTQREDVILANIFTSWVVPTFGGKVVATYHPLSFVPDLPERTENVLRFFSFGLSQKERLHIIEKYNVRFLLLNKQEDRNWEKLAGDFKSISKPLWENQDLLLLKLNE